MRYFQFLKDMMTITGERVGFFVVYALLHIVMEGALLLPPLATAAIIGVLTTGGKVEDIFKWAILYLVFYVAYTIPRIIIWRMYENAAERYHILLQQRLIEHVIKNEGIFDELSRGKIIATCTDDIRWVVDVLDTAGVAAGKIMKLAMIFVIFMFSNIWVAVVAVLADIIYMILMDRNAKKYSKYFDGCRKYEDKAANVINQVVMNSSQIRLMDVLPAMVARYNGTARKWAEQYKKRRFYREKLAVWDEWVSYVGKIVLYVMMAMFVINGKMTVETLVLLIAYFEQVITVTAELWRDNLLAMSQYGVQTARVKRLLSYTQESDIEFGDFDNDYINGLVEFRNVGLKRKGQQVLKGISFKARPNEITAIIGKKGAGKTSVMNLLYRLENATSGRILIDDEDIRNYSKRVHNTNVSGVFQKPFTLDTSIRNNLSLVERNHTKQEEVCKRIGLDKIIAKLPDGYETVITEDESALSEGDKQLLAIARAILTRSEILIFDEVSSVGAQAIPNLSNILQDLKQDHTVIVITHEKNLIEKADRVVELEDGKIKKVTKRRK